MSFLNILKNKIDAIKSDRNELLENVEVGTIITDSNQRIEICRNCEFYFKLTAQCKKCGCFLHAKTKLLSSRCPLKKW